MISLDQEHKQNGFHIPCGCGNRKDIMGAGNWQNDAIIVALVLLVPAGIYAYVKWGK